MRGGLRSGTPPMLMTTTHKLRYRSIPSNNTNKVGTVSPGGDSVTIIMEDNNDGTNNLTTTTMMAEEYPTIERQYNKLSSLSTKLAKYTRGSDRRQVLRTLHDSTLYPKLHTLRGVEGIEDIAAAEREVASERAVLNGVKFLRVPRASIASSTTRAAVATMPVDSYFLQTVREVCGHMCDMDGVTADPMALYGGLLLRLCRSASECDALETLTRWTCCTSGELVLLPIVRRHHTHHLHHATTAAAVANTTTNDVSTMTAPPLQPPPPLAEPLELELYVEGGNVHAKVSMKHEFGLYRRTDLESNNNSIATAAGTTSDTGKNITTTTATLVPWNQLIVLAQQEGLEALVRQQQQAQLHQAQQYNNQPKKNKTRSNNKAATTKSRNDLMSATHELSAIQYTILAQLLRQQQQQIQGSHKVGNIKPWVYINATVVERINFGTGSSVRVLHVAVPEDKNSGYVKK